MATQRLTAASRRAAEETARLTQEKEAWAEFKKSYPLRFATVLLRFKELEHAGFKVTQKDGEFVFKRGWFAEYLTPGLVDYESTALVMNALEGVERELLDYEAEQAEETRKDNVRRAALAKLSTEERELLNL